MSSARIRNIVLGVLLIMSAGLAAANCAGDIVEQEKNKVLTAPELRTALLSGDFRHQNRARKQLGTLTPEARLDLLREVIKSDDPATRTLAVVELAKLGAPAQPTLEEVSKNDPDEDVRDMAAAYLSAPSI